MASKVTNESDKSEIALSEQPNQPASFAFPKRNFGSSQRAFQSAWFVAWKWLHYCEADDSVLCHTCAYAFKEHKLSTKNADKAFITRGFTNWKLATSAFRQHEASDCHKEAVEKMLTLPLTTKDIGEMLSTAHSEEEKNNRECLLTIIANLRYLARQSCAIRGDGDESDSNFMQLLKLSGRSNPEVYEWIITKSNKYTSHDIQNDILMTMSLTVLRDVMSCLQKVILYNYG